MKCVKTMPLALFFDRRWLNSMPSTVISSIHYDASSATLRIGFVSGLVYDYRNVPAEIYTALKTSKTKGIYFNQHIKGHYPFEKIKTNADPGL